ncbi:2166_t:CDS:2 [Diversispora eburnea]|uniref:2166_t:CDS:1 n=1 Tax=Diversispora eburnea TaxID=1213867 RepID=A0A9N8V9M0_9GLOM|nr:2166_t:CDS:2 [Diversispora eburnea]
MSTLQILHFNDVYHLSPQKREPVGGAARFAKAIKDFRQKYDIKTSSVLFSGDVFNPSVESSISKGAHMIPVMNQFGIDVACFGNHDFDFGLPTLKKLVDATTFPWLLSNVLDSESGNPVAGGKKIYILEKGGLKLGILGLVEKEWLETIPGLPSTLQYQDFLKVGKELASQLRDPPYSVDLVIALTHSRLPNDILLAKECEGLIDLVLGGHDHFYYAGKGCDISGWEREEIQGAEHDHGLRVVKSGTDFRELSILEIFVEDGDNVNGGTKKIIKTCSVTRQKITSEIEEDLDFAELVKSATSEISSKMSKPIAHTVTPWDCRSTMLRTQETGFGNFVADLMLNAYQPCLPYNIDCSLVCGGTIRSDSIYPPGEITLGDIMEIFPFEDTVVVIRITGQQLWDALESSLSMVPKQEGRFPIVSGLKVEYNPKAEPFHRLRNVWLTERRPPSPIEDLENKEDNPRNDREREDEQDDSEDPGPHNIIGKLDMQKIYTVCTRAYLAAGYDGFKALAQPNTEFLVDDENGMLMSTLIRKYFLGLYYISAIKFNMSCESKTEEAVRKAASQWKKLAELKREKAAYKHISRRSITDALARSMGDEVKFNTDDDEISPIKEINEDEGESKNKVDFVKDWVTVAPMIEDRIVTVDF